MKTDLGKSMSDVIYNYLLDMILSLQIKPGDRISEAKIASDFNVSRTPIRDALRQLANAGIVNMYPKRFAEVAEYDDLKVKHIGLTRIALDTLAVKMAIYYGSNAEFQALRKFADECFEAAKNNDVSKRIKTDTTFHFELCKISKNESLIDMERSLSLQLEFLQACRYIKAEDPNHQYKAHCDIIDALISRDEDKVVRLIVEQDVNFHSLKEFPKQLY